MSKIFGRFAYPTNICQLGQGGSEYLGIGDEEIGEGDELPADDSDFELFRLEGNDDLPDGLYRWSEAGSVWIQA